MNNINFITATTPKEIEECLKIRKIVFIEEQNVPEETERDDYDAKAIHYLLKADGAPCATARIVLTNKNTGKLGRVAVLKEYRGKGLGKVLTKKITEDVKNKGIKKLVTHSQTYITDFYAKIGFKKIGEEFFEADIPHYKMILEF